MSAVGSSASGRSVERRRGYIVLQWTGTRVDQGDRKRYSVQAAGSLSFGEREFDTLDEALVWVNGAPRLKVVKGSFEAYVPVDATEEQIREWVAFRLHCNGSISCQNPLVDHDFEAHEFDIDEIRAVDR